MIDDRPIETAGQDRLGRAEFARQVASLISASPVNTGYVVSIHGTWGSGKTSTINMIVEAIPEDDWVVVRFNPWMVTRAEELIGRFFQQVVDSISSHDDLRRAEIGKKLARYAVVVGAAKDVPGLGKAAGSLNVIARLAAWWASRKSPLTGDNIEDQRRSLEDALRAQQKRILVTLDDLDRLDEQEIRDVVRLVRLIADFPRMVYLLAIDPSHVAAALGDEGYSYLEKIVQVPLDMPPIRPEDLSRLLLSELDGAVSGIETGPFDSTRWTDVYHRVVRPLVRNLRDVSRLTNGIRPRAALVGEEASLVDVLGLEAVRVRLPDVFAMLYEGRDELTRTTSGLYAGGISNAEQQAAKQILEAILAKSGRDRPAVAEMLKLLFPATESVFGNIHHSDGSLRQWRRDRRVAHPEIIRIYFEQSLLVDQVRPSHVARLFASLADHSTLGRALADMSPESVETALGLLEDYEQDFPVVDAAVIATLVNQLPRLRGSRRGMFDFGSDLVVDRVVLRLLRRIPDDARARVVDEAFLQIETLSGRLALLRLVGYEENAGHELIDRDTWQRHMDSLADEIVTANESQLATERDLGKLVRWVIRIDAERAVTTLRPKLRRVPVTLRLLSSVLGEGFRSTIGDLAVERTTSLPWDWLLSALGEDAAQVILRLPDSVDVAALDTRTAEALDLATRYATGWRPAED